MSAALTARGHAALAVLITGSALATAHAAPSPSTYIVSGVLGTAPTPRPLPDFPDSIGIEPAAPTIGLLLPAVQKIREAAARATPLGETSSNILITPVGPGTPDPSPPPALSLPFTKISVPYYEMRPRNETRSIPGAGTTTETASIIVVPGPGSSAPLIEIPLDPSQPRITFSPYGTGFSGGIRVATGDVNGDGVDDVITGAGTGGGAHVKVFDGRNHALLSSFFAVGPAAYRGGVTVAAGDLDGDGRADIIVGASLASGPEVHTYNFLDIQGLGTGTTTPVQTSAVSYDLKAGKKLFSTEGIHVTAGDLDGDGRAEIIANAFGTPVPGAVDFFPTFLTPTFSPTGALGGFTELDGFANPFGPGYRGGIVAIPAELDPNSRGQEVVFTAFSGFIPEPSGVLPVGAAMLMLASRRRR